MKIKLKVLAIVLGLSIVSLSQVNPIYASSGQWDEDNGYTTIETDYSLTRASKPKHTGKSEVKLIGNSDHKRAVGKTTWTGVYHYTRARMVDKTFFINWGDLNDSGRKWGTTNTSAYSPWWKLDPDVYGVATTNYGN